MFYHTDKDSLETIQPSGLENTTRSYAKIIDEVNRFDLDQLVASGADEKIEALASRGAGDPHPFVISEEATQNMFEMIQHCAQAGLARLAR